MLVGQKIGPFTIERELGSGAMGTVYRATFERTGEPVAFKVIGMSMTRNEAALARFEREAAILKSLKHPNIVRWVGTGRYKGLPFFAMEFIDGEALDAVLARRQRLPWEAVVILGRQLCDALDHAHEKTIIHRDLKPSNLMIARDGVLKLTDFGIAKNPELADLTATNTAIGTAAYMSPEQCRGDKNITTKSDLYSMGIVLYELLTGRKPFTAESAIDMFMQHVSGAFVRPIRIVPEIPIWLDNLVCQLLEKKPDHRPRDAATVGRALEEVLDKVTAQQSAGVGVARARVGDRVYQNDLADEKDVEAAKALKAAGKRRKKKPAKRDPFYRQGWFVLLACVLVLVGMASLILWAVQPPSAERLYADAEKAHASGPPGESAEAAERYLKYYGNLTDPRTEQVRAWQRDAKAVRKEQVVYKRAQLSGVFARSEEFKPAFEALDAEAGGRLADARRLWQGLVDQHRNDKDPDDQAWAWLGEKKLRELSELPRRDEALKKRLQEDRVRGIDTRADDATEGRLLRGLRLEVLGDKIGARDEFRSLARDIGKDVSRRDWLALAGYKAAQLEAEQPPRKGSNAAAEDKADRLATLRRLRTEAETLWKSEDQSEHRKGQLIAQELHFLFREDISPELKAIAVEAEPFTKLRPAG
jgi:serine/threonine-protein kinase